MGGCAVLVAGFVTGWFVYSRVAMNSLRPFYGDYVRKALLEHAA
ncbi:hypothetical protein SBV1_2470018 [Verrucomicrobia bacterium]|nr:hypothetical protein SBV1_2470018 [Verrucomicrobiota bacterium]